MDPLWEWFLGKGSMMGLERRENFHMKQLGEATLSQHVDLEKGLIVIDLLHKMPHQRGGLGLLVGEAII
jgi:hypothetical protein